MCRSMRHVVAFTLLVSLLLAPTPAHAQSAGGDSVGPGATPPPSDLGAGEPSPTWTQDRTFPATRFWKLDAGTYEVEAWWRLRKKRDQDPIHLIQLELEIGLTDRIQLDLYENLLVDETGELFHEGNQIEARIAVDPVYGRTPLNPVIYLEWHPRHLAADRAEVRLLGGGELLGSDLVGAFNLLYEQNVTHEITGDYVPNPEAGVTGALSYAIARQRLRVGAEARFQIEKEELDDAEWEKAFLIGPNVSTRIAGDRLKLYATVLFGVNEDAREVDSFVVLASAW
jgi:hypothetical protein